MGWETPPGAAKHDMDTIPSRVKPHRSCIDPNRAIDIESATIGSGTVRRLSFPRIPESEATQQATTRVRCQACLTNSLSCDRHEQVE